jgi:hypothetical protein
MIGRLGGNNSPMLPEAVNNPVLNFLWYLLLIKTYDKRAPKARIVTPDAPVKVVKKAQTRIAIMARPPGNQPKRDLKSLTILSPALLSERMKPAKAKRGMAGIE